MPDLRPLVLLALLAGIVWAGFILGVGVELRAFEQHRSDGDTAKQPVSSVAQSFRSPKANLSEIELELGSYVGFPADGRIKLLTGDGLNGPPVYEASFTSASFARNPYLTISFPPIATSEGATYTLVLERPGKLLASAFGIHYNSFDTLSSGRMYFNEQVQPGDLAIAAYYHYDLPLLWHDVKDALFQHSLLIISWLCLLWLPGLALLVYLPNKLTAQQRFLAAPGVSALALPVFLLITRAVGVRLGTVSMWLLVLLCAAVLAARFWTRPKPKSKIGVPSGPPKSGNLAFWALLSGVMLLTVAARMLQLRDAAAGMGLDAYHHTLIAEMFVQSGGIPSNYEPYAPLASFTYHYGFHALIAAVAWLSGQTSPTDMLTLMPQAGQLSTALPVLTLTLFAWRVLGDRWAGLAAGGLAGLVSIFPAFYVNWSRYTQGLGLALLPVAWLLLIEALEWSLPTAKDSPNNPNQNPKSITWREAAQRSGPFMLAVVGAAGLALTHYRIAMVYAGFVALYLAWAVLSRLWARKSLRLVWQPVERAILVGVLTLAALSPWLVNLSRNFGARFVGKNSPVSEGYYNLQNMVGGNLLEHPSLSIMFALAFGGLVWAVRRRDPLPLLPALTWLILGVWSNPYMLPVRLPYAGYLDVTTLATGMWLPLALPAGYTLARLGNWILSLGESYAGLKMRLWRLGTSAGLAAVVLVGGGATALLSVPMIDNKPYIARADADAMQWMQVNLPRNAYVLANPFAFPWDPPPQAIQGSDAGLWAPLLAGVRASVPPIPAYNERLADPHYLDNIRNIIQYEPFENQPANWQALKTMGITHIYIGSRGGALSPVLLLKSDHAKLLFHEDAVWLFELR